MPTCTFRPRLATSRSLPIVMMALATVLAAQSPAPPPASLVSLRVPVPPAEVPMDGLDRLVYELHLENHGKAAVALTRLEIRPDAPAVTLSLEGDRLTQALDPPADPAAPHRIPAGAQRVVYLDLGVTANVRGVAVPTRRLRHRVEFRDDGGDTFADDGEGLSVDPVPPVVLGPPLAGGPWVAVHHPDWPRGHRRVFYTVDGRTRLPGRYTIDFVRLDEQGRTSKGDLDLVANSLGYGAEALAVADATVAAARDDMTEPLRISARVKHAQDEAAGNYVSLDLGDGRFAVYEHLKPGSVRVTPGQRVRRGDVVAQLGFTGDSTGPHLHLHVGSAATPLAAEGLPFVFDRFDVLGRYPDIAAMGATRWIGDGAGPRQAERPAPNVVVNFGHAAPH